MSLAIRIGYDRLLEICKNNISTSKALTLDLFSLEEQIEIEITLRVLFGVKNINWIIQSKEDIKNNTR